MCETQWVVAGALTIAEALALAEDLLSGGRPGDAAHVCAKILAADPNHAGTMHLLGIIAHREGNREASVQWLRKAASAAPGLAPAFNDLGNVLMEEGRTQEAIAEYRRAIEAAPDFAAAHNNLGNAWQIAGRLQESVRCYQQAITLSPGYAEAHRNLGSALRRLGRLTEAVASFQTAVSLNPAYAEAVTQLVHEMQSICEWSRIEELTNQLVKVVESQSAAVNPFVFLSLQTTARQQWLCARRWAAEHVPRSGGAGGAACRRPAGRTGGAGKITLGYLSADLQEHATAHLTAELFALHDRERFRVIGYSYGPDDGGAMRQRLMAAFDDFVDLEHASHTEAAARIRSHRVDILIDLKGYTRDARPGIVALRPAPIQVSYLGYPGTMGTDVVDYIIADRFVILEEHQPYFSENVAYLPECYQVNDSTRKIAERVPSRQECGLPESGFVFCCFNASYKLTPQVFQIWVRLLHAVPGSVLWLLASNPEMEQNLRREAEARLAGSAERLVFAPTLPNPEHLARLRLADVFLDTLPYNAHTLTSDALWAGCPVVTCAGETFASRVAGSLLRAVGLPELVTSCLADYEALVARLAREPALLEGVREELKRNRQTTALFDSRRFTRHLESAFEEMWRRYQQGASPGTFAVGSSRSVP
ncbi:MAG TPA: tetratricopeptide repeat protein [Bryobacteraceae bacterium]|nr:tetratricopeptide repeat protein [Bryobacteraceae bacterium]